MKIWGGWMMAAVVGLGCLGGWAQGGGVGAGSAVDAGKRAITFQDLMAMKRVSDPQVSPSGRWVMFSVTDVSLEKNTKVNHLWGTSSTANPNGAGEKGESERQLTFGGGESNGQFSPDGRWVNWTADDAAGESQIFLGAWDEAAGKVGDGKVLTRVSTGADGGIWSPDSKRLMFVSSVYPECSVKGGAAGRAAVDPTHRDTAAMDGAPEQVVIGGTLDVAAWKAAQLAAWAEEDACDKAKDEAAAKSAVKAQVWEGLLYRHWDHYTGEKRSHVLVVDADGQNVRDLTPRSVVGDAETPTFFLGAPIQYAWAPDSKEIAYVTNLDPVPAASTNNDVFALRIDEPGAKAVKVSTSLGSDDGPAYSPDGRWLAFRSQARAGFESDRFRLMLYDREKKTIKEVMPKFDSWVDEFVWAPDSENIYFASPDAGKEPIFRHSIVNGKVQRFTGDGEFSNIVLSKTGQVVATHMAVNEPSTIASIPDSGWIDYWLTAECVRSTKACLMLAVGPPVRIQYIQTIANPNAEILSHLSLQGYDINEALESFWFVGAEGTKVQGFMVRPPNFDPAKKYPVKFLMHGGPQTAWGDAWSYRWNWELMAADGYVVVGINRRGSTGYGQKFVDEVSGDWGGKAYIDLMKGLDAAEARFPFIDKTRECALGASYGGYMADWVLTHTDRFKCIVTHDGMVDPVSAYGTTEELWFNEWEFRRGPATGAAKWDKDPAAPWRYASLPADEDPFRRWSPMRFIENAKTPTLVIHSQRDYRLDVSQGLELFTALQRLGVPSRMLYFPDEGHWVLKPQNSQLWYETVGDWCDRWTKSGKYAEGAGR